MLGRRQKSMEHDEEGGGREGVVIISFSISGTHCHGRRIWYRLNRRLAARWLEHF